MFSPTDRTPSNGRPSRRARTRRRLLVAAGAALALGAAACAPPADPALSHVTPQPAPSVAPPATQLEVTTDPTLFPAFDPSITDYVARCSSAAPITVSVHTPAATTVSVDGQAANFGTFQTSVTRDVGQSFPIVATTASQPPATYYVRCLPADFPTWEIEKSGTPQAEYYQLGGAFAKYVAIVDTNGVPMWWAVPPSPTVFAQLLPDGSFGWLTLNGHAQHVALTGGPPTDIAAPVAGVSAVDQHDMVVLPNGHFVLVINKAVPNVDLSAWGGSFTGTTGTVLDHVFEELDGSGNVVWSWDTLDHIPVAQTAPQWQGAGTACPDGSGGCIDPFHWNSLEAITESNGDPGYVLSFRHLDAVVNLDQTTGEIVWRVGGAAPRTTTTGGTTNANVISAPDAAFTSADIGSAVTDTQGLVPAGTKVASVQSPTSATLSQSTTGNSTNDSFTINAESLQVVGDPVFDSGSHLGGQHDARLLPDGSLTLFDDGTNLGRAPRAVRYAIDLTARTAALAEDLSDPSRVGSAFCCGSSRKLPGGDWVVGWGSSNFVTELTPGGSTVFSLHITSGPFVYRGVPLLPGVLDRNTLRADMDQNTSLAAQARSSSSPSSSVGIP